MRDKINRHNWLAENISARVLVQNTMGYQASDEYCQETNQMIKEKKELNKQIVKYYDDLRASRIGMYEDVDEFLERMENTMTKDDDGNIVFEYYRLGIKAIDDSFFHGKGVFQNSFIAIGADSAVNYCWSTNTFGILLDENKQMIEQYIVEFANNYNSRLY